MFPGDVTSKDSLQSLASYVEKDAGYINFVVCYTGISGL